MSLSGTIRRPDRGPLGPVEEIKRRLSDCFPGVTFSLQEKEPPGAAEARRQMPSFLRLWLALLGKRVRYPHWIGLYESSRAVVEFYFEPDEPVRWIRATSYGMTAGLDYNFERLSVATGWTVVYPRF